MWVRPLIPSSGPFPVRRTPADSLPVLPIFEPLEPRLLLAANIQLELNFIANASSPGSYCYSYHHGDTVRITLQVENDGTSVPVQTALDIIDPNGVTVHDAGDGVRRDDSPLNTGETDLYPFDWVIPAGAALGKYDIGASIRDGNNWNTVYDLLSPGRANITDWSLTHGVFQVLDSPCDLVVPTGVSATKETYYDKVRVTWDSVSGATAYEVWRNTTINSASAIALNTNVTTTCYDDTSADPGRSYFYWVKAKNADGTSGFSTFDWGVRDPMIIESVLGGTADTSFNLKTVFERGDTAVIVLGARNTGYYNVGIHYVLNLAPTGDHSNVQYNSDPVANNKDDGTLYNDGQWYGCLFEWVIGSNAPTGTYDLLGAVRDANDWDHVWDDTQSGPDTATLGPLAWVNNALTVTVAAPTGLSATDGTYADKVELAWGPVSDATGYEVWRNTTNDSSSASALNTNVRTTSYDDTSAVVGTIYYYWVKAKNADGTSGFSSIDSGYRLGTPIIDLAWDSVTDTLGKAKKVFEPGDTARVTLKARNLGQSDVAANWVLNLSPSTAHSNVQFNSDPTPTNRNDETIPADGQWHTLSFDWVIGSSAPTGTYDLLGAVRGANNWNTVLDDTQSGANTATLGPSAWVSSVLTVRSMELALVSVTDTSGNAKTMFLAGDTARVTLKAKNTGPADVAATWVLNLATTGDHGNVQYNNSKNGTIPADDQWHTLSFDWAIGSSAPPGTYDLLGAIRDANDWNTVLDDTQGGANTVTLGPLAWVGSVLTVTAPPSIELTVACVTDTSGNVKTVFARGDTARITLQARSMGSADVAANWVLNLATSGDHNNVQYNSDPSSNNKNDETIPADGQWHSLSFDWVIGSTVPTGTYDLLGAIRDANDWNTVLDDTESGANTATLGPSAWVESVLSIAVDLNVPYFDQGPSQWCWAASASMLVEYYGYDRKLWEIAADENAPQTGATAGRSIGQVHDYLEANFNFGETDAWVMEDCASYDILQTRIMSALDRGNPLFLADDNETHALLVTGYQGTDFDDHVYINDPDLNDGNHDDLLWVDLYARLGITSGHHAQLLYARNSHEATEEKAKINILGPDDAGRSCLWFANTLGGRENSLDLVWDGQEPHPGYRYVTSSGFWQSNAQLGYSASACDVLHYTPYIATSTPGTLELAVTESIFRKNGSNWDYVQGQESSYVSVSGYATARQDAWDPSASLSALSDGDYQVYLSLHDKSGFVHDTCSILFSVNASPIMELAVVSVRDTSENAKTVFVQGQTVVVTLEARNGGPADVAANWVLNLATSGDHDNVQYNSDPSSNNKNDETIPADGQWHSYSFSWVIGSSAPTGTYDLLGAIRDANDWNMVLDDTQSGANTQMLGLSAWVSSVLTVITPPEAALYWRDYQSGTYAPLDNGARDSDPTAGVVRLNPPGWLSEFDIRLTDVVGIDGTTVDASDVTLWRNGVLLQQGVDYWADYTQQYDQYGNEMDLIRIGNSLVGHYTITVGGDIADNAGNIIAPTTWDVYTDETPPEGALYWRDYQNGTYAPLDNGARDSDPTVGVVRLNPPGWLGEFDIRLTDAAGIDDRTVDASDVTLWRNGVQLREGMDYGVNYTSEYDQQSDLDVGLITISGSFVGHYTITVGGDIADNAGNIIAPTTWDVYTDETPPTVDGVLINDGAAERSTVTRIAFQFSKDVCATVDLCDLTIGNDSLGTDVDLSAAIFDYDSGTNTATWNLSGVELASGRYTATLLATGVSDAAGNLLCGGNDYIVEFHRLLADANGDAKVDGGDLALWQQHYDPLGVNQNNAGMGDWNGDGKIDGGDLALWQQNYNPLGIGALSASVPEASAFVETPADKSATTLSPSTESETLSLTPAASDAPALLVAQSESTPDSTQAFGEGELVPSSVAAADVSVPVEVLSAPVERSVPAAPAPQPVVPVQIFVSPAAFTPAPVRLISALCGESPDVPANASVGPVDAVSQAPSMTSATVPGHARKVDPPSSADILSLAWLDVSLS